MSSNSPPQDPVDRVLQFGSVLVGVPFEDLPQALRITTGGRDRRVLQLVAVGEEM
jgi:hypothetical protein